MTMRLTLLVLGVFIAGIQSCKGAEPQYLVALDPAILATEGKTMEQYASDLAEIDGIVVEQDVSIGKVLLLVVSDSKGSIEQVDSFC